MKGNIYQCSGLEQSVRKVVQEELDGGELEFKVDQMQEAMAGVAKIEQDVQTLSHKVAESVSEGVRELQRREFNKKNVIIFNVPMSSSKDTQARIRHDNKCFGTLCKNGLEIKDKLPFRKITRLGKKTDNGRPMKVSFFKKEQAELFLSCTKNLKGKDKFKNVSITTDKTPLEREEIKKLQSLKEERQAASDEMGEDVQWVVRKDRLMKFGLAKENLRENEESQEEEEEEEEEEEDDESQEIWG